MHQDNLAIVKSLVSVAWADGEYGAQEREMVDALISAFEASEEQAAEIRAYAEQPRKIDDIPVLDLSYDDRRVLVQHAVLLTHVDGEQHEKEKAFLGELCKALEIPETESHYLIAGAEARAKKFLNLL